MANADLSIEDYVDALVKVAEQKNDPITTTTNILSLLGGGSLGAAAVAATGIGGGIFGGVLGLIGITTFSLPPLPALVAGGFVGILFVRYLAKSHYRSVIRDREKKLRQQDLRKKIIQYSQNMNKINNEEAQKNTLETILIAFAQKKINNEKCIELINLVITDKMSPSTVLDILINLINDQKTTT